MARFSALTSDSSDSEAEKESGYTSGNDKREANGIKVDTSDEEDGSEEEGDEVGTEESGEEDSEDEDTSSNSGSSDSETEEQTHQTSRRGIPSQNALVEDEDGEFRYTHEMNERSTRHHGQPPVVPWAQQVGVDAQKMRVMQTSLFRMPEEEAVLKALIEPPRARLLKTQNLNRKHSRDSDGDGLRFDSRERTSFAMDIEPPVYRPSRKYARVDSLASAVTGSESAMVDAGLSMGRSFRVGWGPNGVLVHLGELCGPTSSSGTPANSSVVNKTRVPIFPNNDEEEIGRISKLLQHHLSNSPILPDEDGIPFAQPSSSFCFGSFASLFPTTNHSPEALLYRLGHALFDEQDLRLGRSISVDVHNRITAIRRKAALSAWLEEAVSQAVDAELKAGSSTKPVTVAFSLLTGHQIDRACEALMNAGLVKLASLVCQAGGDTEFRADLRDQLRIWREQRTDVHIEEFTRKIYALLAGEITILEGSQGLTPEHCPSVEVSEGLDWKRSFGLHLWYSEPIDAPISQAFLSYEKSWKASPTSVSSPLPPYQNNSSSAPWKTPKDTPDILYSLIRLYSDPACSLSTVLAPLSFGPSPVDYSLCWHLYILLSRCMRVRDFADRQDPGTGTRSGEDEEIEGHSPTADSLTSMYAFQLERLGLLQEAIFVLLHIEGSAGRMKAIKDLLARSAHRIEEWMFRGIVGSLKIPISWINEAKAIHALGNGNYYEAFEMFQSAKLYSSAHEIAVAELAPDAVVRHDFDLLKTLFSGFVQEKSTISSWHFRGQAFLDYAEAMTRLPLLYDSLVETDAAPDAAEESELENLLRSVPKLIGLLPEALRDRSDARQNAALAEMTSGLTQELDKLGPLAISHSQISTSYASEATKLRHLHSATYERFLKNIQVA